VRAIGLGRVAKERRKGGVVSQGRRPRAWRHSRGRRRRGRVGSGHARCGTLPLAGDQRESDRRTKGDPALPHGSKVRHLAPRHKIRGKPMPSRSRPKALYERRARFASGRSRVGRERRRIRAQIREAARPLRGHGHVHELPAARGDPEPLRGALRLRVRCADGIEGR
jgi:hypothetical protein